MDNVKRKSNKLKLAFAVAFVLLLNIVISFTAAAGVVFAGSNGSAGDRGWGTSDLKVGDHITIGSKDWRVVELNSKADNGTGETQSGVLLVLNESLGQYFFDDGSGPYRSSEVTHATVPNLTGLSRDAYGTNYLEEASIKTKLQEDVFATFSDAEKNAIASLPQRQIVWWGEVDRYHPTVLAASIKDWDSPIANLEGTKLYDLNHTVGTSGNDLGFSTDEKTVTEAAKASTNDVYHYTINDKVFLPDVTQIEKIEKATEQGNGVQKLDTLTRTPFAANELTGTQVLAYQGGKIVTKQARGAAVNKMDVTPMMYLDLNTVFASKDADATNTDGAKWSGISNPDDALGYTDVVVGDYITMGGIRWRIIGKDATNGFMVRADVTLAANGDEFVANDPKGVTFDAARPSGKPGSLPARPAINAQMSTAFYKEYPSLTTNIKGTQSSNREESGSNFYWESDVRNLLTNDFMNKFTGYEKSAMIAKERELNYWWGDEKESISLESTYTAQTSGRLLDNYSSQITDYVSEHYNRFDNSSDNALYNVVGDRVAPLAEQAKVLGVPTISKTGTKDYVDTIDANETNVKTIQDALKDLSTYKISDKVFLPTLDEARVAANAQYTDGENTTTKLYNAQGGSYDRVSNKIDKSLDSYLTATPNVFRSTSHATSYESNLFVGSSITVITASGDLLTDGASDNDDGLLPFLYLKSDTQFRTVGSVNINTNEKLIQRPTNVDAGTSAPSGYNSRRGWREFAVAADGTDIDQLPSTTFDSAQVGEKIDAKLVPGKYEVKTTASGWDASNLPTVDANGDLAWTPTKSGQVEFTITNTDESTTMEQTFNVTVALGKVTVSNVALNGVQGGTPTLADVKPTVTPNLPGTIEGFDDSQFPTDQTKVERKATFKPDNANYESKEFTITYTLGSVDAQDDLAEVFDGKTLNAVYGQATSELKDQIQTILTVANLPVVYKFYISPSYNEPGKGNVGETNTVPVYFGVTDANESTYDAVIDIAVNVTQQTVEVPQEILDTPIEVVFGDKVSVVATKLAEATQVDITAKDANKEVGDVSDNGSVELVYDQGSNFAPKDFNKTIKITKAERTEALATAVGERVAKALEGKLVNGTKTADIELPAGITLGEGNDAILSGDEGTEVKLNIVITGKAKQDGEGVYSADNYTEANTTITVKLAKPNAGDTKGGNTALIIVLVIVGVAVIGGAVFMVLKKKQSAGNKF